MIGLLIAFFSCFTFTVALVAMRGTILDITRFRENPWPIFWYIQLLLVLVPVIVVSVVGIEGIWTTGARVLLGAIPGTEIEIAFMTIGTLFLYIVSLAFFLRIVGLKALQDEIIFIKDCKRVIFQCAWGLIFVGTFILVIFEVFGFRHAFITSWLSSERLLEVRLANVYKSSVPSQIIPVFFWISCFLSMFGGFVFRLKQKKHGILFGLYSLFLVSAPGDKAPVIIVILLWLIAARIRIPRVIYSFKIVVLGSVGLVFVGSLIYFLFRQQYPDAGFSEFILYVLSRLGVGQMNGTYATFGLAMSGNFPVGEYYWGLIPGANFFNREYVNYQKVLMMVTEGYDFTEMGVANSYFIAEAFAIGGYPLVWLSPIIVALASVVGIMVFRKMLAFLLWRPLAPQLSLVLFLITHDITGGFNGFPLFKGLIAVSTILFFVLWPIKMWRSFQYALRKST